MMPTIRDWLKIFLPFKKFASSKIFCLQNQKKRKKGFTNVNFYWQQIEYDRFPNIKSKIMRKHMVELILRIPF